MSKTTVFMFSGQGSQYYHMGKELFNNHPIFRDWMFKLDDIVQHYINKSVIDEMYNDNKRRGETFDHTLLTHPAIFIIEYSLAQVLLEIGIKPDYVMGTSLGEFATTAVSGGMEVENVIECLLKQAEAFESYCKNSGMLAILYNVGLYHENPLLFKNIELASINYHSHFVIAGENEKLAEVISFLKGENIIFQLLPVSFGFHSSCIDPAEKVYINFIKKKLFKKPTIPFISCLLGTELTEFPENFFWDVTRKPIQFQRAIQELEKHQECIYLDLGPAGTLANFTKNNLLKGSLS